jgi:aminopeptidase
MPNNTQYVPPQKILEKYADVLVNYALNSGEGLKPGEIVQCNIPDVAKALGLEIQNAILKAGGHPMVRLMATGFEKDFFTLANDAQLTFFPAEYLKARINTIDHSISIIADVDPEELKEISPSKMIMSRNSKRQVYDWMVEKETQDKFTWTLGLWGTPAKANEVGLSEEEYWEQIINACFLNEENPVNKWRELQKMQNEIRAQLNALEIEKVHVVGPDVDLHVKLGCNRIWNGGTGRNIPSFELFTSPDWRGTNGWIKFNQTLYRYGNIIRDVSLEFKDGLVTKAHAKTGNDLLQEMLKSKNANKIGEYSLTDKRMSKITHVMAETLYDENIGGPFGNTHLAIGRAYKDCYRGNPAEITPEQWEEFGFNDSPEHTDIISTTDRTVTALLSNGVEKVIYRKGQFVL